MPDNETRCYLLSKPEAREDFPFGPSLYVYKIKGRMFVLIRYVKNTAKINLKCDPQEAMVLRDVFGAVEPGYHMNKAHWNTVTLDGSIPQGEIERMIDRSYELVVKNLTKVEQKHLKVIYGRNRRYD
ncbi:MAG: hypothetical protein CMD77_08945 [Gammaproteobacteria bacterium]|nr:hypothetical protein [Gammaproteobacteria bacterium]